MLVKIFNIIRQKFIPLLVTVGRYLFTQTDASGDGAKDSAQTRKFWQKIVRPDENIAKKGIILLIALILILETFGFLDPISRAIDNQTFSFAVGSIYLSFYVVLKTILWMILLLWGASHATDILDSQMKKLKIHSASRTLVYKISQTLIYVIVFLIAMNILGINLTSLAFFSGALGIGIGFGMQKIAANLISGFILTFERSLVPGTLIELADGRVGYIKKISVRYTLLEAVDGLEILIPNEQLVTNQLVNWTLSNTEVRAILEVGVSYNADIHLVQNIILQAAQANPKISTEKPPAVHLKDFGDNAVIFELIYWIKDVTQHYRDVRSEILFYIWDEFKQHQIDIPYPQLDLHMINQDK